MLKLLYINVEKQRERQREERALFYGRSPDWSDVKASVQQGSILGPLLFLIYINNLSEGIYSNTKLFADSTSLFSVIHDSYASTPELNNDLAKIGFSV